MTYDITDNEYLEIENLRQDGMKFREIKRNLFARYPDMPVPTLRKKFYFWLGRAGDPPTRTQSAPAPVSRGITWTPQGNNAATLSYETPRDPRLGMVVSTLEELLEVGEVDQSVWRVVRFKDNAWGQNSASSGYTTIYHVTAWLERIVPVNAQIAIDEALAELRSAAPRWRTVNIGPAADDSLMYEVAIGDAHIGRRGWFDEAGHEYNIEVAGERIACATTKLLRHVRSYTIESIIVAMVGDMINADGPEGKTTRGTRQDMSGQYLEVFRAARRMMTDAIKTFAEIAPVKVIIVSGNHDKYSSYLLADIIEAQFFNDERVAVDNTPLPRKYQRYGKNLIGFTHKPDPRKLPGLMTVEQSKAWGETTHREFHTGHLHTEKVLVDTVYGVTMRGLPAITSPDEWTVAEGYLGSDPGAQGFLWHKEEHLIGTFNAKVV